MIKDIKPQIYTITIHDKQMKLRYDMNALDFLERTAGNLQKAFTDRSIQGQKRIIRAALLCNYPQNLKLLDEGKIDDLKPAMSQVGEWFDMDTIRAVSVELYKIALDQLSSQEGENSLGEQQTAEILVTAIGALSKLYGQASLTKAFKTFSAQHRKKS